MARHGEPTPTPVTGNLVPTTPDIPFGADANDVQRALSPRQQALADFAQRTGADTNAILANAGVGRNLTAEELTRKRAKENFFTGIFESRPVQAIWQGLMWSEHNVARPVHSPLVAPI